MKIIMSSLISDSFGSQQTISCKASLCFLKSVGFLPKILFHNLCISCDNFTNKGYNQFLQNEKNILSLFKTVHIVVHETIPFHQRPPEI